MNAEQALAELTAISAQIDSAVVFDASGSVLAATLADAERSRRVAESSHKLLAAAAQTRPSLGGEGVRQLEAATPEGHVFVVREGDQVVAATTAPNPTAGLVLFDLRTCLRNVAGDDERADAQTDGGGQPKRKRTRRRPAKPSAEDAGP